jgi:hypothetical protein
MKLAQCQPNLVAADSQKDNNEMFSLLRNMTVHYPVHTGLSPDPMLGQVKSNHIVAHFPTTSSFLKTENYCLESLIPCSCIKHTQTFRGTIFRVPFCIWAYIWCLNFNDKKGLHF